MTTDQRAYVRELREVLQLLIRDGHSEATRADAKRRAQELLKRDDW